MTYVITQSCCKDASCVPVCPVNCIHPTAGEADFGASEMLYIDPDSCIDCGACFEVCPVAAITYDEELTGANLPYRKINADYFLDPARKDYSPMRFTSLRPNIEISERTALRVAIVGSGPSASYAVEALLKYRELEVEVDVFERLPTPGGLVRFGVAPDHADTKAVAEMFARTSRRRGVNFHLNVEVGTHVTHAELMAHHHAVIYAVGASSDRALGIPGEDLPGSHAATDFVNWYNGHPDHAGASFDLSGDRAVVVGNGNVALDVARILAAEVRYLAKTDIADHALDALAASRISEVVVLGRRGPAQAAYTTPELLGLTTTPGLDVVVDPSEAQLDSMTSADLAAHPYSTMALKLDVLGQIAGRATRAENKRVRLRFLTSPVEVLGDDHVEGLRVCRNTLTMLPDGRLGARPSSVTEDLDCGLLLRSVGYRGVPVAELPFDDAKGILPNQEGRVVDPATGAAIAGVYAAGWIKRGPSGFIGTNKECSEDTVRAIVEDLAQGRLIEPAKPRSSFQELIAHRQAEAIDYTGWKAIDLYERTAGKQYQRPRVKLVHVDQMLQVAGLARSTEPAG